MEVLEFNGLNAISVFRALCGRSQQEVLAYFPDIDPWRLFWALKEMADLGWVFRANGTAAVLTATKANQELPVGECWSISMLTTDKFQHLAKPLTKRIKEHIIPLLGGLGATRLECCSLAEPSPMQKWMRRLGARQDSVLRQHGRNDEDFILFAWDI